MTSQTQDRVHVPEPSSHVHTRTHQAHQFDHMADRATKVQELLVIAG